ncbi:N,N-dimethylformamidase beta subunit family domain-containing protein [Nibribacter koreensis]
MVPQPLEGYAHQLFYTPGQTVLFHLKALQHGNRLVLQRRTATETWELVTEHSFGEIVKPETLEDAQQGCHWSVGWEYALPHNQPQGYYRALLVNEAFNLSSETHFIVGSAQPISKVAVLAPVTTWQAYNAYGGHSLYRNAVAAESVSFVSTLRPNTALTYHRSSSHQHDLRLESHIYHWFAEHYQADLLPDYWLEKHPERMDSYQVLVLSYHAEYFSEAMFQTLQNLVLQQNKSLLSLGGNQVYWQVRWHQNFTQVECPKNGSFFQNSPKRGGLWRHTSTPESLLLGAHFTEAGINTYAPYQVIEASHWLFENYEVKNGDIFGQAGIDGLPICGDETDKTTWSSPENTVVLARGLNKATATSDVEVYKQEDNAWDSTGGGEMTITELSKQHAVLATGSIQSGSGLSVDKVFTQMIGNFMRRYVHSAIDDTTSGTSAKARVSE